MSIGLLAGRGSVARPGPPLLVPSLARAPTINGNADKLSAAQRRVMEASIAFAPANGSVEMAAGSQAGILPFSNNIRLSADDDNRTADAVLASLDGIPVDRNAVPFSRDGIPVDRNGVPVDRDSVPLDRNGVPLDRDGVPVDWNGVPVDRDGVPVDRDGIPVERDGVPIERDSVPVDRNGVPVEWDGVPLDRDGVPLDRDGVPVDRNGAPVSRNGVPVSLIDGSRSQLGDEAAPFPNAVLLPHGALFSQCRRFALHNLPREPGPAELASTDQHGYRAGHYVQLTPVLIEALKEQQHQVQTRQAQNAARQQAQASTRANAQKRQAQLARLLSQAPPQATGRLKASR